MLWFGGSDGADVFAWQVTDPDPDRWRVVAWSRHDGIWCPFEGGFLEFLIALVRDEFEPLSHIIKGRAHWTTAGDWSRSRLLVSAGPPPTWSWLHDAYQDRT